MRPLTAETQDLRTLQDLGMASIQIVHDLKNQLNGLKLYATFLRKRMETSERPEDELEAITKLIGGLERTASELTALVRYGRPIELRTQRSVPVDKILASIQGRHESSDEIQLETDGAPANGDFDLAALSEALATITEGAFNMRSTGKPLLIHQRRDNELEHERVLIEWRNVQPKVDDVFRSLAGSAALRMSLAAKIIEAHNGEVEQGADTLRVSLPISRV